MGTLTAIVNGIMHSHDLKAFGGWKNHGIVAA